MLEYSAIWALHLQHFDAILKLLLEHKLYAKLSKCSKINYLGHVSMAGVEMDQSKVHDIL